MSNNKLAIIAAIIALVAVAVVAVPVDDTDAVAAEAEYYEADGAIIVTIPGVDAVNATWEIVGADGQVVLSGDTYVFGGSAVVPVDTPLAAGEYNVKVTLTTGSSAGTVYEGAITVEGQTVDQVTVSVPEIANADVAVTDAEGKPVEGPVAPGTVLTVTVSNIDPSVEEPVVVVNGGEPLVAENGVYTTTVEVPATSATFEIQVSVTDGATATVQHTVTFVVDGVQYDQATVEDGQTVAAPADPSKEGATFNGWYYNGQPYDFAAPVTSDMTLVANWTATGGSDPVVMEEMYVNGVYSSEETRFTSNQIVIVDGTLTLASGAYMWIYGQLVVPEGSELIIEPNAHLYLVNDSEDIVVADIDGTVVVDQDDTIGAGFFNVQAGTVSLAGEMSVYGDVVATGADFVVETDGTATIEETGTLSGATTVRGVLDVYGRLTTSTIDNYGTVTFNSTQPAVADVTVNMLQSGAVLDIQCYTTDGYDIIVTDANLEFKAATNKDPAVNVGNHKYSAPNEIVISASSDDAYTVAQVSGVLITENVTQRTVNKEVRYYNTIDVSGTVTVTPVYEGPDVPGELKATATLALNGQRSVAVTDALVLGTNVTANNGGILDVSGSITATAGNLTNGENGEVTVSGAGIITAKTPFDGAPGIVNATKYTTVQGENTVTVYVTIDTALATVNQDGNTITQLVLLGENTVTVSATLPAGVTLNTAGATLNIGERNGSDVVLTVAEGASVRGAATVVNVNGTLFAENKRNVNNTTIGAIVADVYSEELDADGKAVRDGWARWTNVYTAMAEASEGDVIEVFKDATDAAGNAQYVELTQNLTVPAGVTLMVPQGKAALLLNDGVTLTVNGTVQTYPDIYAESRFGTTAMDVEATAQAKAKQSSAIVVNGYLYAFNGLSYGNSADGENVALSAGAPVAGAYYQYKIDNTVYDAVSPLANALANVAGIQNDIEIYGAVNAGDVTFTATEDCDTITVAVPEVTVTDMNGQPVDTVLTVGSLTLVGSAVIAEAEINGSVIVGEAVLDVADVKMVAIIDGGEDGMLVTGPVVATAEKGSAITVTAGTATFVTSNESVANVSADVTVTVAAGATMVSDNATVGKLTVDGTLEVAENSSVTAGTMTVNGTANIGANETASVTGKLVVLGQFNVAVATETSNAGTATAAHLDVGISDKNIEDGVAGTTGTVSGLVTVTGTADVSAQATISAETQSALDPKISTAFEVEGAVWFTNYVPAAVTEALPEKAPVENAYLAGWEDENGDRISGDYEKDADSTVSAVINYNVYRIYVLANEAVDDVFIDGNLMQYGTIETPGMTAYYGYYALVSAGNHEISYTLANGYSGEGVLTVNGTQQSGWNFTTEGTPGDSGYIDYNLQLTGFEKSGYVPDSPDTPSDSGDDGMSITDILLIVLVILIIVMAIIVAVRLMRS